MALSRLLLVVLGYRFRAKRQRIPEKAAIHTHAVASRQHAAIGFEDEMARYIDSILQPGEKLLYSTTLHGIIYLPGILCWLIAAACFVGAGIMPPLLFGAGIFAVIGLFFVLKAWFQRWTTETDVTTLRVVHKTGFISRETFEMSLDKVESVDVDQSVFGRIFGWGDITIRGVGEGVERIRMIGSPLQFRNHITAR